MQGGQGLLTLSSCLTQNVLRLGRTQPCGSLYAPCGQTARLWEETDPTCSWPPPHLCPRKEALPQTVLGSFHSQRGCLGGLTSSHSTSRAPGELGSVLGPAQDALGGGVTFPVLLEMSRALHPLHQGQPLLRAWEVTRGSTSATFIPPLRPFLQPGPHPVSKRLLVSYRKEPTHRDSQGVGAS